ncbi:MAG TPA: regulatory protein RecX [Actinomycetes bacterium]|nr:regulatory protein RecX [Actinomycetes bacterium]
MSDHNEPARGRGRRRTGESDSGQKLGRQSPITDPEKARAICLKQLSWAPRTRSQLARAMRRRGVTDEVAARILARFEDVGLIDDAAFAAAWVESRHVGRSVGRRKLAQELHNRGVAGTIVREAVDALPAEIERATAYALVNRRLPSTAGQPAALRARRLAGILARKGYPAGLAYDVVRDALAAEGQELPEVDIPDELDELDAGGR